MTPGSFRNEITPRNFIFRVREFEQMELEFFVKPGSDEDWHKYWVDQRLKWWSEQGVSSNKLKLLEVEKEELSHYSKATFDIMYDHWLKRHHYANILETLWHNFVLH